VPFRARLVCASNRDVAAAVAAGTFREDRYHRINIVTLQVPPLRERREDIPELVQALVQRANREVGKAITSVEQAVLDNLKARDWPGNVRELEHVISRSLLRARGPVLTIHDLGFDPEGAAPADSASGLDGLLGALEVQASRLVEAAVRGDTDVPVHELAIHRLEGALIRGALAATGGNQVAAARLLGISRSTLRSKL
jgi:DNA-binding NtrC family response regulator